MKRVIAIATLCLAFVVVAGADVRFTGLNLSADNVLLVTAELELPGLGRYGTLFAASLDERELKQLSFFPEKAELIDGRVQLHNRFGLFRSDREMTGFEAVPGFPAFVDGAQVNAGKLQPYRTSPDGRYVITVEQSSPAYGALVLRDLESGTRVTVAERVEFTLDGPPVSWAPGSDYFLYSYDGGIYYYALTQRRDTRDLAEELRRIGDGDIRNVRWGEDNTLYYVTGSFVYRILPVEFFTRSLYQDLLKIGRVIGKIPFTFDPNFDQFWIAPDGQTIMVGIGGRNLFLYYLYQDDFESTGRIISLPSLFLPRNTRIHDVVWSESGIATVTAGSLVRGESSTTLYRLELESYRDELRFERLEDTDVRAIVLSPDQTRIAVLEADEVVVREYETWREVARIRHTEPLHVLWRSSDSLVVLGSERSEVVTLRGGAADRRHLAYSQIERYGVAADGAVHVETDGVIRAYDIETGFFRGVGAYDVTEPRVASSTYRVYLETIGSGSYQNKVMVRMIDGIGTEPLFLPPERRYEPFPDRDDPVDLTNFIHGSRIRRREVAFVFNAIESVDGLTEILKTLSEYGITATFFLNGDFIRSHPGAVREIAGSGHEIGSLFFTHFDMTDSRFQITREFVKQGLARTEDEYYDVTGQELSLLWHAPYYFVSPEIIRASRDVNYTYVGRDVDSLDWVARRDEGGVSRLYAPTAHLIERIVEEKKPGSIVSMTVGIPGEGTRDAGRDDYLFHRLDVLINALLDRGYSIVPVSELIDRVR